MPTPPLFYIHDYHEGEGTHVLLAIPKHTRSASRGGDTSADVDVASEKVGMIAWRAASATVAGLYVEPTWRRQGVATSLWHAAHLTASPRRALGIAAERTVLGELWARSVLGDPGPVTTLLPPLTRHADTLDAHPRQLVADDTDAVVADISATTGLPANVVRIFTADSHEAAILAQRRLR